MESEIESEIESVEIDSDIDREEDAEEEMEVVVSEARGFLFAPSGFRKIELFVCEEDGEGGEEEDREDPPEDDKLGLLLGTDFGRTLF